MDGGSDADNGLFPVGRRYSLCHLAGLLAITTKSLDLYILDRYFLILPTRLLFVSALLVLTALAIWERKISR